MSDTNEVKNLKLVLLNNDYENRYYIKDFSVGMNLPIVMCYWSAHCMDLAQN